MIDEVNAYEEDIERVVGIYAPHLGSELVHVTRTAEWRIVPKLLTVESLTLKSGIAAPRSPVNNCGEICSYIEEDNIYRQVSEEIGGLWMLNSHYKWGLRFTAPMNCYKLFCL